MKFEIESIDMTPANNALLSSKLDHLCFDHLSIPAAEMFILSANIDMPKAGTFEDMVSLLTVRGMISWYLFAQIPKVALH